MIQSKLKKLLEFEPQITDPKWGPEPSLIELLTNYYVRNGCKLECVQEYVNALADQAENLES